MLRVLTLSTLYPDAGRPGFGRFVARQTQALAAQAGITVAVAAPVGLPPWPLRRARHRLAAALPTYDEYSGLPVLRPRFVTLPGPLARWNARSLATALAPVLTELRRNFAFDVIDAEFFWPDGPAAVMLGRRFGVPVSIKARGSDIHHWSAIPEVRRRIVAAADQAQGLLAVSGALADTMATIGIARDRIAVHYTGIDATLFRPVDRAAAKVVMDIEGPLFVAVGTLGANKGQHIAIDALSRLPAGTLVLAGAGPAKASLEARAMPLGARVRFAGTLAPEALARLIAAADALVHPAANEGLANVWVEALACGTPVIASHAGGIAEVLDRSEAGVIVDREAGAVAAAMAAIAAAPPSQEAVRAAAARFSWEANGAALASHLRRLVAQR